MTGNAPEDSQPIPPDEWFIESYAKDDVRVNFYDIYGKVEPIPAFWREGNIFWLDETPLRVNGVSIEDVVEVEWRENEITPYFVRIREKSNFRTFRAQLSSKDATDKRLVEFLKTNTYSYRIDRNVLAFSVYRDAGDPVMEVIEWLTVKFDIRGEETDSAEGQHSPT
jgi:hypothetical protein